MYTRGGKSTVEKPTLVNKPKIYKGRLGEVREARGGKSTKPIFVTRKGRVFPYFDFRSYLTFSCIYHISLAGFESCLEKI